MYSLYTVYTEKALGNGYPVPVPRNCGKLALLFVFICQSLSMIHKVFWIRVEVLARSGSTLNLDYADPKRWMIWIR